MTEGDRDKDRKLYKYVLGLAYTAQKACVDVPPLLVKCAARRSKYTSIEPKALLLAYIAVSSPFDADDSNQY